MSDRLTVGQYYPGHSIAHRTDPRIKIILTIWFIVCIFFVEGFRGLGLFAALALGVLWIARIPLKLLIKGLRPIFFILLFTYILNLLTTPGEVVFRWWIFQVTQEGLWKATFMALRIVLLVMGTSLLTLTTAPLAMTDGMEALLSPLRIVRFPAHELAMMMSIALRFIPTLFDESEKIMKAQKARGADFETGNVLKRAQSLIPLMVPLFLNAFHRADELGTAMEARCYRGGAGRTRLNPLHFEAKDFIVFFVFGSICFFIAKLF